MAVVSKDKMHIQGKSIEHTVLRVGARGERQEVRVGGGREEGSGLRGEGRGSQEKGKKKTSDKDDILSPSRLSVDEGYMDQNSWHQQHQNHVHACVHQKKLKLENQVPDTLTFTNSQSTLGYASAAFGQHADFY